MTQNKQKRILNLLLDRYERRGLYDAQTLENVRAVTLNIGKEFPEYKDAFRVEDIAEFDAAIEDLTIRNVLSGRKDARGMYGTVRLCLSSVEEAYRLVGRTSISFVRQRQVHLLRQYESAGGPALWAFCKSQLERLAQNKSIAFGIGDEYETLWHTLMALQAIERLSQETYARNFSEAVFHDSKRFQTIRPKIERILCEYGDQQVASKRILEQYNLFDNPAHIWVKGLLQVAYLGGMINVAAVPGGIALPSRSLGQIQSIVVRCAKIVTVENLTTYHDTEESDCAVFYLGGFLNQTRRQFLQKIYADNPKLSFSHKGDLDVYGFLILEHLKSSTGIPFEPIDMDLSTLQRCYDAGHYKHLTEQDKKAMASSELHPYKEILQFMLEHNCKVEQESLEAMRLSYLS
ncbi:MAG: DUF2220 family protein [Candidatus Pelethousia sp.]|nr:DUF2220 family protein [Candidatus Pelethousia sp.]